MKAGNKPFRARDYDFEPLADVAKATGLPVEVLQGLTGAKKADGDFRTGYKTRDTIEQAIQLGQLVASFEATQARTSSKSANAGGPTSLASMRTSNGLDTKLAISKLAKTLDKQITKLSKAETTPASFTRLNMLKVAASTAKAVAASDVFQKKRGVFNAKNAAQLPETLAKFAESIDDTGAPATELAFAQQTAELCANALARGGDFYTALDAAIDGFNSGKDNDEILRGQYVVGVHWVGDDKLTLPSHQAHRSGDFNVNRSLTTLDALLERVPSKEGAPFRRRQQKLELVPPEEIYQAVKKGNVSKRLAKLIGGGKAASVAAVQAELKEQFSYFGPHYVVDHDKLQEHCGDHMPVLPANKGADPVDALDATYDFAGPPKTEPRKQRKYLDLRLNVSLEGRSRTECQRLSAAQRGWEEVDDGVFAFKEFLAGQDSKALGYWSNYDSRQVRTSMGKRADRIENFILRRGEFEDHRWTSKLFVAALDTPGSRVFKDFTSLANWAGSGDPARAQIMTRLAEAADTHDDPETLKTIVDVLAFFNARATKWPDSPVTTFEKNLPVLLIKGEISKIGKAIEVVLKSSGKKPLGDGIEAREAKLPAGWATKEIAHVDVTDRAPVGTEHLASRIDSKNRKTSDGAAHPNLRQAYLHQDAIATAEGLEALKYDSDAGAYADAVTLLRGAIERRADPDLLQAFDGSPGSNEVADALRGTPLEVAYTKFAATDAPVAANPFEGPPSDPALRACYDKFSPAPSDVIGTVMFFPNFEGRALNKQLVEAMDENATRTTRDRQLAVLTDAGKVLNAIATAVAGEKPALSKALNKTLEFAASATAPSASLAQREASLSALNRGLSLILNMFIAAKTDEDMALAMVGSQKQSSADISFVATDARAGTVKRNAAWYAGDCVAVLDFFEAALPSGHPARAVASSASAEAREQLAANDVGKGFLAACEGIGHALEATEKGKNVMDRMWYLGVEAIQK